MAKEYRYKAIEKGVLPNPYKAVEKGEVVVLSAPLPRKSKWLLPEGEANARKELPLMPFMRAVKKPTKNTVPPTAVRPHYQAQIDAMEGKTGDTGDGSVVAE